MTGEREVIFGQAFHPKGECEALYIITDTSPQYNPQSISAAKVVIEATDDGIVERLGLPGGINPEDIGQIHELWALDRIIKAMGMTFNGNLPEDMQELLRENSAKPPRKLN